MARLARVVLPGVVHHVTQRGAVFESWIASEIYKSRVHAGMPPGLFHYRETRGIEIDLILDQGSSMDVIEVKSGSTISQEFFKNFKHFTSRLSLLNSDQKNRNYLLYGGDHSQKRTNAEVLSWKDVHRLVI